MFYMNIRFCSLNKNKSNEVGYQIFIFNQLMDRSELATEHIYIYNSISVLNENDSFFASNVYRDSDIHHRFWFKFPAELRTAQNRNRMMGIRACTLRSTDKKLSFDLEIIKTNVSTQKSVSLTVNILSSFTKDDSFKDFIRDIRFYVKNAVDVKKAEWEAEGLPLISQYDIGYLFEQKDDNLCFVLEAREQRNDFDVNSLIAESQIRIKNMNEQMMKMFLITNDELSNEFQKKIYFPCVWDRNEVLLKSNIATNSFKNYLCFSNRIYTPVKYFQLNMNETEFWIEMYNGIEHNTPAIISLDGTDTFVLEVILI